MDEAMVPFENNRERICIASLKLLHHTLIAEC
jgi:hypothetical protein